MVKVDYRGVTICGCRGYMEQKPQWWVEDDGRLLAFCQSYRIATAFVDTLLREGRVSERQTKESV